MASIQLGGSGDQYISLANRPASLDDTRNVRLLDITADRALVSAEVRNGSTFVPVLISYTGNFTDPNRVQVTSAFLDSQDGQFEFSISGISWSFDAGQSLTAGGIDRLVFETLQGSDRLEGSPDGGPVQTRLLGGNDFVRIRSGSDNFINGNAGNDFIDLAGGGGQILGGSDADQILVQAGSWDVVNGNQGDDEIIAQGATRGVIRGGSGNDIITSFGTSVAVYGDRGADTFKLGGFGSGGVTVVKDFELGVDALDIPTGLQSVSFSGNTQTSATPATVFSIAANGRDTLLSTGEGDLYAVIENVILDPSLV